MNVKIRKGIEEGAVRFQVNPNVIYYGVSLPTSMRLL